MSVALVAIVAFAGGLFVAAAVALVMFMLLRKALKWVRALVAGLAFLFVLAVAFAAVAVAVGLGPA